MTFIKSNTRKSIITFILMGMVCLLIVGGAMLVFAYTRSNDIGQNLRLAKEKLQEHQAENARLKGELLSLFDAANLAQFAKERSLVLEKKPSYIELDRNSQWHFASGR